MKWGGKGEKMEEMWRKVGGNMKKGGENGGKGGEN